MYFGMHHLLNTTPWTSKISAFQNYLIALIHQKHSPWNGGSWDIWKKVKNPWHSSCIQEIYQKPCLNACYQQQITGLQKICCLCCLPYAVWLLCCLSVKCILFYYLPLNVFETCCKHLWRWTLCIFQLLFPYISILILTVDTQCVWENIKVLFLSHTHTSFRNVEQRQTHFLSLLHTLSICRTSRAVTHTRERHTHTHRKGDTIVTQRDDVVA